MHYKRKTTIAQMLAEKTAAMVIGNIYIQSDEVAADIDLNRDTLKHDHYDGHYLFLGVKGDLETFFGCGTPGGAVDTMVLDKRILYLFCYPEPMCPNCNEDILDEICRLSDDQCADYLTQLFDAALRTWGGDGDA